MKKIILRTTEQVRQFLRDHDNVRTPKLTPPAKCDLPCVAVVNETDCDPYPVQYDVEYVYPWDLT